MPYSPSALWTPVCPICTVCIQCVCVHVCVCVCVCVCVLGYMHILLSTVYVAVNFRCVQVQRSKEHSKQRVWERGYELFLRTVYEF